MQDYWKFDKSNWVRTKEENKTNLSWKVSNWYNIDISRNVSMGLF